MQNTPRPRTRRIAIVHDWLITYGGAERTLKSMLECLPEADIFTMADFLPPQDRGFLSGRKIITSPLQNMPGARRHYRAYLPLMPLWVEQFDLSGYDLVISSSHAVAKGVLTGPDQLHLCYIYSPMRYAWDLQHQYLRETGKGRGLRGWVVRYMLHRLRLWDARTAAGVDRFVAISHFVGRRVAKAYRRESEVIYPPVDVEAFRLWEGKEDFYLTASRMVPYKRIDLIVDAFRQLPDKRLVVIGDGPEMKKIRALAGPNVTLLGYQPSHVLVDYLQRAKAFIFAAEEDFGIAPLEAQASGTPVIAYGKGGALETIHGQGDAQPTGVFFQEQSVESLRSAIRYFETLEIRPGACRENALRFNEDRFKAEFLALVEREWSAFHAGW
ncbi:glycosyltransferase family 4 protein [Thiofaba sp. EF100]|uniref:glycosyltransferase family 4 protein n=1 Tax=Thiofaba sp. EF100 TaxID=3121274 RepID=UPI003221AA97